MNRLHCSFVICALLGLQAQLSTCCGEDNVVGDRIVGGSNAVKHSIPWQAALVQSGGNGPFCGGTIIDDTHILTAAHCTVQISSPSDIQVLTGEHDTSVAQGETRHSVKAILNHPSYNGQTTDYDYAIITLGEKVDLTDKARAACLPAAGDASRYEVSGAKFNVSGWGTLSSGGSQPDILNVVTVPFVSDSQCKNLYTGSITDRMMCAGDVANGGIDSCQGDSGGPLTWKDTSSGTWKIVGVVSWGAGCAGKEAPGVYAQVESVLAWVKSNSGGNSGGSGPSNPTTAGPPNPSTNGPTNAPPSSNGPTDAPPNPSTENPTTGEPTGCVSEWIGDNFCDDENNNAGCDFDGGDCCGDDVNTQFCQECECLGA